jgi:Uma2 family endonuclease
MNKPERHPFETDLALPLVALRRWTADELQQIDAAGVFAEGEHVELIAGKVLAMTPKGNHHELLRNRLTVNWARRLPLDKSFAEEPAFRLSEHDEPEPDIILFDASEDVIQVRGETVLLVVEISDPSYSYDLMVKAPLYASFGVRDYWVIDARSLMTTVHRQPRGGRYTESKELGPSELITPALVTGLAIQIADLGIAPVGR